MIIGIQNSIAKNSAILLIIIPAYINCWLGENVANMPLTDVIALNATPDYQCGFFVAIHEVYKKTTNLVKSELTGRF
ncbi:hypothetical protein YERSI8AC_90020 [Enterobacterales bacterium 8AC]|nr:hypothetical protein YERSI8AC_90020 [Enterobacterales bacterium 8AC]